MPSVTKVIDEIINRSPFLRESLSENLINVSALARKIKPEIEDRINKDVNTGAIVMAIKRVSPTFYNEIQDSIKNFMGAIGDFLVRSDLESFTFENSESLNECQAEMMKTLNSEINPFYTFSRGINETSIITNSSLAKLLKETFKNEILKSHTKELASITTKLPTENTQLSGIYYYILKQLAWEGINIIEVISTTNEFTIIVKADDIDLAFSVMMQLKKDGKKSLHQS